MARSPLNSLDPALDRAILEATVRDGPAVDGVTPGQTITIDSIDCAGHHRVLRAIRDLVEIRSGPGAAARRGLRGP